ncbi:MAG: WYL domain-containing protein [Leptospiraceae bacterium]|nr:WYL domain-containing protein [Leptospiraceae bacterium]
MSTVNERLKQKLGLIKLLSTNNGMSLEEIANFSSQGDTKKIKQELGELFMVGTFPYTPADYIEIDFDGEKLKMNLPVNLDKAIGLSVSEWNSLRETIDKQIISKKNDTQKLELLQNIKERIKRIVPYSEFIEHELKIKILQEAIEKSKQIQFDYQKRSEELPKNRIVEPWIIFDEGSKYLIAYCTEKKDLRTFRLEEIRNLKILEIEFSNKPALEKLNQHIQGFKEFIQTNKEESSIAQILFEKQSYYNLSKLFNLEIIERKFIFNDNSYVKAKVKIIEKEWFFQNLKAFGTSVILISPDVLRQEFIEDLNRIQVPELIL